MGTGMVWAIAFVAFGLGFVFGVWLLEQVEDGWEG